MFLGAFLRDSASWGFFRDLLMRAIARSALSSRHLSPRLARSSLPLCPSLRNSSTMSAAPIDGIVLGVSGGKPANADVARATSIDVASQWAASRASNTKPGQLRVFYPSKVSVFRFLALGGGVADVFSSI